MPETKIFAAKRVITMDRNRPQATHVAVRDGRIIAVGDKDCAEPWGGGQPDDRFASSVIMPGLVEGHSHLMEGGLWRYTYVGYRDRTAPDGSLWQGIRTNAEVIRRLGKAPEDGPVIGWGFDPIFMQDKPLDRDDLDCVSSDRPVAILFSNLHLLVCNTVALRMSGLEDGVPVEGVMRDADGRVTGELREMAAMFPVLRRLKIDFRELTTGKDVLHAFAASARRAGVTTATDLYSALAADDVIETSSLVEDPAFPLRLVPAIGATDADPEKIVADLLALKRQSGNKLRLGAAKLMTDGSIQGYSARLKWPGYVNGSPNGIWNIAPDRLRTLIRTLHAAGIQMHVHVNGDEASEVVISAMSEAMRGPGPRDHRHILQHGQMMDEAQFRQAAALGLGVNLFANHLYHFGDQHFDLTVGPDRAMRMNACRSALDAGIPLAIHSDAPVTPLAPLFTAWCAVNRLSATGRILGAEQALTVSEALHAITLGAAWTLKMDHEIGSIETGKFADFAILADDPFTVDKVALKDVNVCGTVVGGEVFE